MQAHIVPADFLHPLAFVEFQLTGSSYSFLEVLHSALSGIARVYLYLLGHSG